MELAHQWRVTPRLTALKLIGALVFGVAALIGDPVQRLFVGAGAVLLLLMAARDLFAPVRLMADPAGVVVVTGFARRRWLPWSRIERVRVDVRQRLGLRTELLEIDVDDNLYYFSTYELSAPCADVAETLAALRTGNTT